jgi:hypothetical protein
MYVPFFPDSSPRSPFVPMNGAKPVPLRQVRQSNAQIDGVARAAADAYLASKTVASDMSTSFLGRTVLTPSTLDPSTVIAPAGSAPEVEGLNFASAWTAPLPAMPCYPNPYGGAGVPWGNELSRVGGVGAAGLVSWVKSNLGLAAIVAAGAAFGLSQLGKKGRQR